MQMLGQTLHDVAPLVHLPALNRGVLAERPADRLPQCFRPVDDEQTADLRVEPALDQIVDERLHDGCILGRPLD